MVPLDFRPLAFGLKDESVFEEPRSESIDEWEEALGDEADG